MAGKHIRVTSFSQPPEQTGGTLDIGEEKSKGLHKQSVRSPPSRCVRPAHYLDRAPVGPQTSGLRMNEVSHVYLADVNWDLGQLVPGIETSAPAPDDLAPASAASAPAPAPRIS